MKQSSVQSRGFTLIELTIVLLLLSIMVAIVTPSLRGFGQGQKLKNAADSFVAATGYARSQAVATAAPFAVSIDSGENTFVVQKIDSAGTRTAASGDSGVPVKMPENFTIKMISGGASAGPTPIQTNGNGGSVLLFYPDSRSTPAVIEIASPAGTTARIESASPAEPFARTDAGK